MAILKNFQRENLIQIYTKTHQIALFNHLKKFLGGACQISKSEKNSCSPLSNPGYTPATTCKFLHPIKIILAPFPPPYLFRATPQTAHTKRLLLYYPK